MEKRYTIEDSSLNVAYNNMTEYAVKFYVVRMGWVSYEEGIKMSLSSAVNILNKNGHKLFTEGDDPKAKYKGDEQMGYKGKNSKQIIKNVDAPDVELYFFELLEMSYNQLNTMLNDYLDLYNAFKDYSYRMNALIIMEAINTKKAKSKEVNIS